jgi:pimeloyl-ACP methyl ester carboxylesterase
MTGRARTLFAVAAAIVGIVLAGAPASARQSVPLGPDGDAFYAPPDPLPKAKPGTLVRAQPMNAPDGAQAWRVLYHSRAVNGRDIVVSGVVVVPDGDAPKGGRPVVTWAHGTTGLADVCTPSKGPDAAKRIAGVNDYVAAGYVVVATDYEGLGPPGLHPYLVGESEGRSVLDAVRAARRLKTAHAGRNVVVAGHSQGGHAALAAGELAADYAPELHVLGVVAVAPAADLEVILPAAGALPGATGFLVMGVEGFNAAYPKAGFEDLLTPEAVKTARIVDEKCGGDVVAAFRGAGDTIVAKNPLDVPAVRKVIHLNSAGNRPAGAPVLVVQGDADTLIVKPLTDAFVKKACALGDSIDYRVYPGAGHGPVIVAAIHDIVGWVADRLRGDAAASTCP